MTVDSCVIILTKKENSLIEKLREIPYGQVIIIMKNGEPIRIEQIKQSIEL